MLIDSNIIIYSTQPAHEALREFIRARAPAVSIISYIEVLGFHRLSETERILLDQFFHSAEVLPLCDSVAEAAIQLRQLRRINLGDSIIAATALVGRRALVTHNVEGFSWIDGLTIIDPLEQSP